MAGRRSEIYATRYLAEGPLEFTHARARRRNTCSIVLCDLVGMSFFRGWNAGAHLDLAARTARRLSAVFVEDTASADNGVVNGF